MGVGPAIAWKTVFAKKGRPDSLPNEVDALVALFPSEDNLSREQLHALVAMQKRVGAALKEAGALSTRYGDLAVERGAPQSDGANMARHLRRRERASFEDGLTRALDAIALGTWINEHHDQLARSGVEWPVAEVERHLDLKADLRRIQRELG